MKEYPENANRERSEELCLQGGALRFCLLKKATHFLRMLFLDVQYLSQGRKI
jgi:hypothetical protein